MEQSAREKKYDSYDLDRYMADVLQNGLQKTWEGINTHVLRSATQNNFFAPENLAELYEIGLAAQDKAAKKASGQYYTPDDVAAVMANWLLAQKGDNVADVACGTGNLILAYLDAVGRREATKLLGEGKIYLYDSDETALNICKTRLLLKYGRQYGQTVHAVCCDFLSEEVALPPNCKAIANPPYATVSALRSDWEKTEVAVQTKELYAMFMEKILAQSESAVTITPYSFLGGQKFYPLRRLMNANSGFIVAFDNVPGNIFCGRKHGVFNTNTANSVRAAITVVENGAGQSGFRVTPLIRFKNEERGRLLQNDVLEGFLGENRQTVSSASPMYCKCQRQLAAVWEAWQAHSRHRLGEYVTARGEYVLSMPSTCRYFTSAAVGKMNRNGQITLLFEDEDVYFYVYCMLNSSFAYWYWRLFDGGITYSKRLLLDLPVFYEELTAADRQFFRETAQEMMACASKYVTTKNNVGAQENIKFPKAFRDKINKKLLSVLNVEADEGVFDSVHSNMALKIHLS